ncbi:MAG TPA: Crp/Fnr family transcriptional regulator [Sphingopyxis sp.]|nr:Crp/Fnr family transcriptional regulator [Sphingopyxis sp.]
MQRGERTEDEVLSLVRGEFAELLRQILLNFEREDKAAWPRVLWRVNRRVVSGVNDELALIASEPRAVLGEIALLDGGERTASVTATSAGAALQLGRNAMRDFAASHPEFAWSLMQQLARRLRTADQTIESDRAYASGPRLARYLRRLIRTDVETAQRVELSQTELGNFAGMSREHINRQLRSWEESGIIALEQGRVRVLDVDTLEDISESEG